MDSGMKTIIKTALLSMFSIFFLQGCAQDESSPQQVPAAPAVLIGHYDEPPVLFPPPEKLCRQELSCQDRCNATFKFEDPKAIARRYGTSGGTAFYALVKNALSILNHDACMNTPLSEIADFLYSPLTYEDLGRYQFGAGYYCFANEKWSPCN